MSLIKKIIKHLNFSTWKSSPKAPTVYQVGWRIKLGKRKKKKRDDIDSK